MGQDFIPDDEFKEDTAENRADQGFRQAGTAIGNQMDQAQSDFNEKMARARQGDYSGLGDLGQNLALGTVGGEGSGVAQEAALPMDEAARMSRAKEMGFNVDQPLYHGTHADIDRFKLGLEKPGTQFGQGVYVTSTPRLASEYTHPDKIGGNVLPVYSSVKNTFDLDADADKKLIKLLKDRFPIKTAKEYFNKVKSNSDVFHYMRGNLSPFEQTEILQKAGYDSLYSPRDKVMNIFEPKNIRSKFAEFDPDKKSSPKLSYAAGGLVPDQNFIPDDQFKPDQQVAAAPQSASAPASFIPDSDFVSDEEKYGGIGQQALTVGENVAKGFAGPVATLAEAGLSSLGVPGLSPEEQAGREAANPYTAGISQATGLGAGIFTGTGEAALLEKAGQGALKAAGVLSKPATLIGRAGASALKGAVETSLYQTGDEISKKINDPESSVPSALAHVTLGGLIGAVGGGLLGPLLPVWAHSHGEAVEQGIKDFQGAVEGSVADHAAEGPARLIEDAGLGSSLRKQKINAPELEDIAKRNEWPIAEGITSGSKEIQKAEDALLNGPPTLPSLSRQKIYNDIYNKVDTSVDRATGVNANIISETQAGDALKASLSSKLEAENAPIKALYGELENNLQEIPVSKAAIQPIVRSLNKELENLAPGTGRFNYMKSMIDRLDWIDDLSKLKTFRSEAGKSAGIESKDLAGKIAETLNGAEERAIKRFADKQADPTVLNGLIDQVQNAKGQYKEFITKLQTLGKSMGKSKVYGPQDFINFIDGMNPQTLSRKLFNENNTQFTQYFAKHFPEEMNIMRGYQRGLVREGAMKEGVFNAPKAIKSVMKLEPEMQKLLYAPEELKVLNDADQYLRAFPESFNPSGTAHTSAFRAFFEHPTGAMIANLRDYGIQSFIKAFSRAAPGAEGQADKLLPLLGNAVMNKEANPGAFKNAVDYTMATIKGDTTVSKAVKSLFSAAGPVAATMLPKEEHIESLDKKLKEFQNNVDKYASVGGSIDHYLPNHDIALKSMVMNASNYVNNARPVAQKNSPLDKEIEPTKAQKATYNRLLTIAHQPLTTLGYLKDGTLTPIDMANLTAMYPAFHKDVSQKIMSEMVSHTSKGHPLSYSMKRGLSTFLGHPLDSTLTQHSMQSIMMSNAPKGGQAQMGAPKKVSQSTSSTMEKMNKMYATPSQARAASRISGH